MHVDWFIRAALFLPCAFAKRCVFFFQLVFLIKRCYLRYMVSVFISLNVTAATVFTWQHMYLNVSS